MGTVRVTPAQRAPQPGWPLAGTSALCTDREEAARDRARRVRNRSRHEQRVSVADFQPAPSQPVARLSVSAYACALTSGETSVISAPVAIFRMVPMILDLIIPALVSALRTFFVHRLVEGRTRAVAWSGAQIAKAAPAREDISTHSTQTPHETETRGAAERVSISRDCPCLRSLRRILPLLPSSPPPSPPPIGLTSEA